MSPDLFRRSLRIDPKSSRLWGDSLQRWQLDDFKALDDGWKRLAGFDVVPVLSRAYIERPRGHSKTADVAVQIAWILLFAANKVTGFAAAADREQGTLIRDAVSHLVRLNPYLCGGLRVLKNEIVNPRTDSRLTVISSDVQSSWGLLPDFVICDELCHWASPDLWHSLLSSAAKRPHCLLAVLTNAGVGRDWHWQVREQARNSSAWHFSSLEGVYAPWITAAALEEQRLMLPPPVYERLWLNKWQHSDGEFVTLAEAEACRRPDLERREQGRPGTSYMAAIDYAEKHDYTVGIVVHRDGELIIVDRMDVAVPQPDRPVLVAWVEQWMEEIAAGFPDIAFIIDEYQLVGTIQQLQSKHRIRRFQFSAGAGNHALAMNLRRLIIHRHVAWYPGCGQLADMADRDDLETELASLLLRQSTSGRVRIDHHHGAHHHDDRAFTLGAACLHLSQSAPDTEWLDITPPDAGGEFAW